MVSVILGSSYHIGVCSSVHLSDNFSFIQLFEANKTGCAQLAPNDVKITGGVRIWDHLASLP